MYVCMYYMCMYVCKVRPSIKKALSAQVEDTIPKHCHTFSRRQSYDIRHHSLCYIVCMHVDGEEYLKIASKYNSMLKK